MCTCSIPAASGQQTSTRGVDFILGLVVFRVTLYWWKGLGHTFIQYSYHKNMICVRILIIWILFFIILSIKFMLSRGQMCITTHSLQMNRTLVRFRDTLWCTQSQPNESTWLCESYWRSSQRLITFGTLFFCFLENRKFNITFVITWCKLYHMLKN